MEKDSKTPGFTADAFGCPSGSPEEMQRYIVQKLDIVGQLAGGISHNFNNQLTGIMGFANLIAMRAENENIKKFAGEIIGICKNAGDMVRELLAFARYKPMSAAVLNINSAITTVTNLLANSIDKRITISADLCSEPCLVFADAVQLQSLLLNIALNSKDAMPAGGKLSFSTKRVAADNPAAPCGYVRIEIADTGHGFGDDVKARLFEPFFTTKAQGHVGLGLSSAYNLVKMMNGTIELTSEAGKGTSAAVTLPIHDTEARHGAGGADANGKAASEKGAAAGKTDGPDAAADGADKKTRGTILLVDDDNCIRDSLSAFLRGNDYSVFTAVDGLDAVEKYGKTGGRSIDLVIIDMVMPRMDGKEAFVKMKEINPSITAIGITGYTTYTQEEMSALGLKRMLHKPFAFEELLNAVARHIQR